MKVQILMAIFIAIASLPIKADAKVPFNSDFCDKIFSANFEMQVDGEFPECKNRFKWNVNRIMSSFNHN